MRLVGIDTETFLGRPGLQTPKVVCISIYDSAREQPELYHLNFDRPAALRRVRELFRDPDAYMVGHNIAYDIVCLSNEFGGLIEDAIKAANDDRIADTEIRQKLRYMAQGRFRWDWHESQKTYWNLGAVAYSWLGVRMDKKNSPRKGYSALWNKPLLEWTEEEVEYSVADAVIPVQVYEAQGEYGEALIPFSDGSGGIVDEHNQVRAALGLRLTSAHGMMTDGVAVDALETSLQVEVDEAMASLKDTGFFRKSGSKNLREIQYVLFEAYDHNPPLADAGQQILDGEKERGNEEKLLKFLQAKGLDPEYEDLSDDPKKPDIRLAAPWWKIDRASYSEDCCLKSGNPDLKKLGQILSSLNELNNFIPVLKRGVSYPITTYYNSLIITGRCSSARPNVQNLPRRPGVRECFVPREGKVFVFCDFDSLEIRTWAQCCLAVLGYSVAADNYRKDPNWDPHTFMAAAIIGDLTYEEAMAIKKDRHHPRFKEVKNARQLAKIPDFGLPGGMGVDALIEFAYGYGVELTHEEAENLKRIWREVFPEAGPYFEWVGDSVNGHGVCVQLFSNRQRGGCGYCDFANSNFQGLAADLAKEALWRVVVECYTDSTSPLYGARACAFIHDEIVIEVDEGVAHEAALRLQAIMEEVGNKWCPDVPILAGLAMARRWYKGAEAVYDDNGRLIPWEP